MGQGAGKKGWLQTRIRLMNTNPNTTLSENINPALHLQSTVRKKEAHEIYEEGAPTYFNNGWCANHNGRRICEK